MAELWEMQESDTPKAWEAFVAYRDMGSERSIQKVAKALSKSEALIKRWSAKHDWVVRAAAWDSEQDRLLRAEMRRGIGQMRKRHADLAVKILEKAAAALEMIPPDEVKASDVGRMVDVATKLERISRGDVGEVIEERDGGEAVDPVQIYIPDNTRGDKDEFDDLTV